MKTDFKDGEHFILKAPKKKGWGVGKVMANGLEERSDFPIHCFHIWNTKEYSMRLNYIKFKNRERKCNNPSEGLSVTI